MTSLRPGILPLALLLSVGLTHVRAQDTPPAGGRTLQIDVVASDDDGNPVTDLTPLLRLRSLVNLGLDETDTTRVTGIDELRAAGISVHELGNNRRPDRPPSR